MALEIAGLSLAAITLLGTFKDCIDLLSYISVAKSMPKTYDLLITKLELEKVSLLLWAERVRLGTTDYDSTLDDDRIGPAVLQALKSIRGLFTESSAYESRYGLQRVSPDQSTSSSLSISDKPLKDFNRDFKKLNLEQSIDKKVEIKAHTVFSRIRWAIHDKDKFQALIDELTYFTNKLGSLMPDTTHDASSQFRTLLESIQKPQHCRLILDACPDQQSVIAQVATEHHAENCRKRILDCIWFRSMDQRRDEVTAPCPKTFDWALEPAFEVQGCSDLPSWLREGSGIYWIAGKPASGKSTLMKHILYHPTTAECLNAWSTGCPLSTASFFFRNLGTQDQKSHDGLSRALLFNALSADQDLIEHLLPHMWKETFEQAPEDLQVPSPGETRCAFDILASRVPKSKFCFFIDGLDEYEGDYHDGIALLKQLSKCSNIKIIVSSRPITPCYDAFHQYPMLKLDALNKRDIEIYIAANITEHPSMNEMLVSYPQEAAEIQTSLVQKAEGVFLWVVLACRSLTYGFAAGDYIHELESRLNDLPGELGDLFSHILSQIESDYIEEAIQLLQLAYQMQRVCGSDASLMTASLAVAAGYGFDPFRAPLPVNIPVYERRNKCLHFEKRLRSRCRGLLEVVDHLPGTPCSICLCRRSSHGDDLPHDDSVDSTVRFLHRTLVEYLDVSDSWIPSSFEPRYPSYDPTAACALVSMYTIWFVDGISFEPARARWIENMFCFMREAPPTAHDEISCTLWIFIRLSSLIEATSGCVRYFCTVRRYAECHVTAAESSPELLLAIENGMTAHVTTLLERDGVTPDNRRAAKSIWLYHALKGSSLSESRGSGVPARPELVERLLDVGCDPNKLDDAGESSWYQWLHQWHRRDRLPNDDGASARAVLRITTAFLSHGADPTPHQETQIASLLSWTRKVPNPYMPDVRRKRAEQVRLVTALENEIRRLGAGYRRREIESSPDASRLLRWWRSN